MNRPTTPAEIPCTECAAPVDAEIHAEEMGLCLPCSDHYWGHTGPWSEGEWLDCDRHPDVECYRLIERDGQTSYDCDDTEGETLNTERIKHNGAIIVSAIIGGYRVAETYYGYTEQEARQQFGQQHLETGGN